MGDIFTVKATGRAKLGLENRSGCLAVLSGGSAARRATRSFTESLWMTLSSSRSPVLQLCLGLSLPQNIGPGHGAVATPVTTALFPIILRFPGLDRSNATK